MSPYPGISKRRGSLQKIIMHVLRQRGETPAHFQKQGEIYGRARAQLKGRVKPTPSWLVVPEEEQQEVTKRDDGGLNRT
jgi:hypothetical protein